MVAAHPGRPAKAGEWLGIGGEVMHDWRERSVERRAPLGTAAGKILHLHVARGGAEPGCNSSNTSSAG